jgi:hypothetical protein
MWVWWSSCSANWHYAWWSVDTTLCGELQGPDSMNAHRWLVQVCYGTCNIQKYIPKNIHIGRRLLCSRVENMFGGGRARTSEILVQIVHS